MMREDVSEMMVSTLEVMFSIKINLLLNIMKQPTTCDTKYNWKLVSFPKKPHVIGCVHSI